jgi:hypothetical protein
MAYFDTDGDGSINFDEFLVGVRVSIQINYIAIAFDSRVSMPNIYLLSNPFRGR